MNSDIVLTSL